MRNTTTLAVLCLFLLYHSASAQLFQPVNFQPVADFPAIQLWANWYEQAFVDNPTGKGAYPCPIFSFHEGCAANFYQVGFANGTVDGPLFINTQTVAETDQPGVFTVTTNVGAVGSLYVLDYDPLFEWVILGDTVTVGMFITALCKSPWRNEALLTRVTEIANSYNFTISEANYNLHSRDCNYTDILLQQQEGRRQYEQNANLP